MKKMITMKSSLTIGLVFSMAFLAGCGQDESQQTSASPQAEQSMTPNQQPEKTVETPKKVVEPVQSEAKPQSQPVAKAAQSIEHSGADIYASCVGCHGAVAEGGVGPKLQGRSEKELLTALQEYKAGKQRGPLTSMMAPNVTGLSETDLESVAKFITTLK